MFNDKRIKELEERIDALDYRVSLIGMVANDLALDKIRECKSKSADQMFKELNYKKIEGSKNES